MVSQIGAIERQVAEVRRRRNLFAAQQVLYVPVAIAGALILVLVALAFVLPAERYVLAVWAAIVVFAFGVIRAIRRLRASWLGTDAPRTIDHSVALEERLTTLAALSAKRPESRLWGHLVNENLRLLGRWTPQALTPRRVPRSVIPAAVGALAILALLVLGLAGGEADGGFMPRAGARPEAADSGDEELSAEGGAEGADGGMLVDWSEMLAAMPERLREEILRRAKRAVPGTDPPPGAKPVGRGQGRGAAGAGAGPESDREKEGEQIAKDASGAPGKGKVPGTELARRKGGETGSSLAPQEPAKGDGLKVLGQRPKGKEGGGSSGGGPGAGAGTAAGGLYGDKEGEARPDGIFALDLDAERGDGGDEGDGSERDRPASPLANEQRIDDAVRRAQVPADYEKIVQRLFSRGDAGEAAETR